MRLPRITASQLHYGLATAATLVLIVKYALAQFDAGFGAWVIAFWTTAVANDRLNTPSPNGAS